VDEVLALAAVRKAIETRRKEIAEKWPKRLSRSEYHFTRGRHEELEALALVVQQSIAKANAVGEDDDDDNEA
jgi:hypothetical protein